MDAGQGHEEEYGVSRAGALALSKKAGSGVRCREATEALEYFCGASFHGLLLEWFFEGHREHDIKGFKVSIPLP